MESSDSPFPVAAWGWMRPQGKWATQRGNMLRLGGQGQGWVAPVHVYTLDFVILGGPFIKGMLLWLFWIPGFRACKLALCPHLISSFYEDAFRPGFGLLLYLGRLWLRRPSFSLGIPKGNQTFTGMFWSCWPTSVPLPPPLQRRGPTGAEHIFHLVGKQNGHCCSVTN